MNTWTSISDVARDFGLPEDERPESTRDGLRRLLSSVHPDKNGGTFKSETDKAYFFRIKEALDYVEEQLGSTLSVIPVSQLPSIVASVAQALAVESTPSSQTLRSTYREDVRHQISRDLVMPRLGSGVFAAVTAFLVAFPDRFEQNPFLGPLLALM